MASIVQTVGLKKHFGTVTAVDGIDILIDKGEIYGFLGLNGAGKTTTIRMLLGMIRPDSGKAMLLGEPVSPSSLNLWNKVGYLVEIPYSYPELTVRENLEIVRRMRFIDDRKAVDRVMEKLKIDRYRDRKAKHLSLGNGQRLGIAKAIIHNPDILILDEPANGLDPAGIVEIRELLRDMAFNKGVTILVSSHILGEVARFATRIGIIHEGKMVRETETNELFRFLNRRLLIKATNITGCRELLLKNGYTVNETDKGDLELTGADALDHPEKVNQFLVNAGILPSKLLVDEEDLESYFLRVIGKNGGVA